MKYIIFLACLLLGSKSFCQNTDSLRMGLKWKNAPFYCRSSPLLVYTGPALGKDRISQYIEIGKSFDIIDLGIALGRNSLRPDSSAYLEGKVTMDVGNIGIFANEMTIGAGRVFDNRGSLMLELSYNIFMQVSKHWGFGLSTGFYDFSNSVYGSSKTTFGLMLRYGLQRDDSGGILNLAGRGHHATKRIGKHRMH